MKRDFTEVFLDFSVSYGNDKIITPRNSKSISFFLEKEKIIHRDLVKEDEIFEEMIPLINRCTKK
jgi:hypothetical protein